MSYDYGKAIDRSRQVVRRLTGGVGSLLRKNGVEHIGGRATLRSANTVSIDGSERAISADNIIIATGARARHIPGIPVDGETVLTSREAIVLREVPRRVVIVGGGAIGVEFADIYHSYGAEVTVVEMLPRARSPWRTRKSASSLSVSSVVAASSTRREQWSRASSSATASLPCQ